MAKGKRNHKGKKVTLKAAKNSIRITFDGKRRLDLSKMAIASMPKCLLKLCDIEELDLSRNFIRKIPDWIQRFQNLRWLDLHSNQIEKLPESIGQLQNLLYLNVCNNKLTANGIPIELSHLKNLRQLNLGLNSIDVLPTTLGNLKELKEVCLFDNHLTSVPPGILKLPKLKKINTKRNPIQNTEEKTEEEQQETIERVKCLHLVNEKDLCSPCLAKYQMDKSKLKKLKDLMASAMKNPFSSNHVSPNSTAKETMVNVGE
ncbi:leucine-rich repeat-containing protein 18 [Bufo bufo]|uniref:leucine-rich repeat-containing protein 18 n=1 Tax=Bufo bufo TaxID=8384 RepID=UPI001ABE40B2|nr:leucine-rich repeat-containing protein 18 [Bufo bufo]